MKLVDNNVWLALTVTGHRHHASAASWFVEQADSDVGFCRFTQLALMRLLTTTAVLGVYGEPPLTNAEALRVLDGLVDDRRVAFAPEPADLDRHLRLFAARRTASPKLWMDAYLAAFAIAGGHRLVTADRAFLQFDGLEPELLH